MAATTPLAEMSPNIQESEAVGRKRSHDEYTDGLVKLSSESEAKRPSSGVAPKIADVDRESNFLSSPGLKGGKLAEPLAVMPPATRQPVTNCSPHSSPPGLVEDDTSIAHNSSPQTPSKPSSEQITDDKTSTSATATQASALASTTTTQPPKRKRLTAAEKEAQDKEQAEKKKEREEKAAVRAAEKARIEEEKAERAKERAKEREEKRKQKEDEEKVKAQEREEKRKKKEEDDKIKAQKAQEKEDKKRHEREAKEKKERLQPKLNSFFAAPSTPKKAAVTTLSANASPEKASPVAALSKAPDSAYQKLFQPFYIKDNTTLAPPATCMDQETKEAKSAILDQFISGTRIHAKSSLDITEVLALPEKPPRRGRLYHPVKHIMEDVYKESQTTGADDSHKVIQTARKKLAKVPMKVIAFSQDVRPPYYGTVTFKPFVLGKGQMSRIARNSTTRRLPLEYDYDSEAEWQDDEGEDLDVDDDESDVDDEDDMDGFLDDSEDAGLARRVFVNTIEPDSSGICFEDDRRLGPNATVFAHKMEIMLDSTCRPATTVTEGNTCIDARARISEIDPWSTAYWEPEPKPASKTAGEKVTAKMPPPVAPTNALAALNDGPKATSVKVVNDNLLIDVKKAILDNKVLSKAGIVDFIFQQLREKGASRTEVKNTIEMVAEKAGAGKVKEWTLKQGHELPT